MQSNQLMTDTLYFMKKLYNLKTLEQLDFHPNANDYNNYYYQSGYKLFHGPVYSERWIYNRVFRWSKNNYETYTVVIEPTVTETRYGPKENYHDTLNKLKKYIEETL